MFPSARHTCKTTFESLLESNSNRGTMTAESLQVFLPKSAI